MRPSIILPKSSVWKSIQESSCLLVSGYPKRPSALSTASRGLGAAISSRQHASRQAILFGFAAHPVSNVEGIKKLAQQLAESQRA